MKITTLQAATEQDIDLVLECINVVAATTTLVVGEAFFEFFAMLLNSEPVHVISEGGEPNETAVSR